MTTFKGGGVFFPSISPDGKHIVFQHDFDLYTLDVPSGKPKKLAIAMAFDPKESEIVVLSTQSRAEGFAISPAGDYMAVDYHGEIVVTPTEQGVGEKNQITNSAWRDRGEVYSPDGRKIAYVSDEGGEQQVWLYDLTSATRKKLTKSPAEKDNITWAPGSQKLAYTADNRVFEVDVASGEPRELGHNPARWRHHLAVLAGRQLARLQPARRRAERRSLSVRHQGKEGIQHDAKRVERNEWHSSRPTARRSSSRRTATAE